MAYFLLLAAFLAVAGIGCAVRRRSDFFGTVLVIAGSIGCAGLIIWQVRSTFAGSPGTELDRYHAAASYTLASQVARQLAGQRGQIVLIYPPEPSADSDAVTSLTYAFARALQASPALQLRQTNLAAPKGSRKDNPRSLAGFEQAFGNGPNDVAYVSFAGVPPGIEDLARFQQKPAPQLFVFDPSGTTGWRAGLKKGVIRRVIVPRPDVPLPKEEEITGRPEEVFQRFFLMATPETADQIAAQLDRK